MPLDPARAAVLGVQRGEEPEDRQDDPDCEPGVSPRGEPWLGLRSEPYQSADFDRCLCESGTHVCEAWGRYGGNEGHGQDLTVVALVCGR